MPKTVRISLFIYVGLLALELFQVWLNRRGASVIFENSTLTAATVVLIIITTCFAILAYMRRNWARWVHASITLTLAALLVFFEIYYILNVEPSIGSGVLNLAVPLVQVFAAALLFTPTANAWFSSYVARAA